VDVLDERAAEPLAQWLRAHPGVQVVCRDRAGAYAEGARDGAPEAIQCADRWHLWKNLCDAVQDTVRDQRADLAEPAAEPAAEAVAEPESQAAPALPVPLPKTPAETRTETRTTVRTRERHAAVHSLVANGWTVSAISRELRLDRKTVRKFRDAATAEQLINGPRLCPKPIDRFGSYLHQRWNEGIRDATVLHAEITARGYHGSTRSVRRYLQPLRAALAATPPPEPPPKVREVTRWITSRPDRLTDEQATKLHDITTRSQPLGALAEHVTAFAQIMTARTGAQDLEEWIAAAQDSDLPHLASCARGLRRDQDAVTNGLTLPHSSGAVEGNVTRIKALKRQMYGRANLDLLRKRILLTA
jgi:transposase